MNTLVRRIAPRLAAAPAGLALVLPGGRRLGPADASVTLHFARWRGVAALAAGQVGRVAQDIVEGRAELQGSLRAAMATAVHLLPHSPVHGGPAANWRHRLRSLLRHTRAADARQIRAHYDVSDDFYALWLDPRRVYSCAYFERADASLAQAQEAKLDLICRKLMLRPGQRFLDVGAGWGGLLLWAAEHYCVQAQGVTLSRHQHAHVNRLIEARGLQGRVRMDLCDYRDLDESEGYDRIASVGMFEHVGCARLPAYFAKLRRLLRPGGLALNHGITAAGLNNAALGHGMGDFIERYIFPGGELVHVSRVLRALAAGGLEMVDVENLRPHYARTLWAWSDALEARLPEARAVLAASHGVQQADKLLRAYRLYLAGCALGFEQGWLALHQVLASHPTGSVSDAASPLAGAQSVYPFHRGYMYPSP